MSDEIARGCAPRAISASQQISQYVEVDLMELVDILHADGLVDLVNRRIHYAQLDNLRPHGCDEPAVRGSATRGQFRPRPRYGLDG